MTMLHARALILLAGAAAALHLAPGPASAQCVLTQRQRLLTNDLNTGDVFGSWVALAGDRAFIGAYGDDAGGAEAGAVYVFVWSGSPGEWSQEAKLIMSDSAANDQIGINQIAASGDRVLIGSPLHDVPSSNSGSAYVFKRSGFVWSQEAILVGSDTAADDDFGSGAAISGDRILIGAPDHDATASNAGAVYAFNWNGAAWVQHSKFQPTDPEINNRFGNNIAMDGDRAIIGQYLDDDPIGGAGSAYIFEWNGAAWVQQAKIQASDAASNDQFGVKVALAGDLALVTAGSDDHGIVTDVGSVYLFEKVGPNWVQQAKFIPADPAQFDSFGWSIGIYGAWALVGVLGEDYPPANNAGTALLYRDTGSGWALHSTIPPCDPSNVGSFGRGGAIGPGRVLIGAIGVDVVGSGEGVTYDYILPEDAVITRHPVAVALTAGEPVASFSVVATGAHPIAYQWRRAGSPISDGPAPGGGTFVGTTTSALLINSPTSGADGAYDCIITGSCGPSTTSTAANLTVTSAPPPFCAGDADGNGVVNFGDVTKVLEFFNFICP